jgi:hypothetical protein
MCELFSKKRCRNSDRSGVGHTAVSLLSNTVYVDINYSFVVYRENVCAIFMLYLYDFILVI